MLGEGGELVSHKDFMPPHPWVIYLMFLVQGINDFVLFLTIELREDSCSSEYHFTDKE